jgi:hypothetical protein
VPQAQVASSEAQLIGYALSRHVPAMQHGFEVITAYGPWRVDGELAQQMAELMRQHLMNQLATVEARSMSAAQATTKSAQPVLAVMEALWPTTGATNKTWPKPAKPRQWLLPAPLRR